MCLRARSFGNIITNLPEPNYHILLFCLLVVVVIVYSEYRRQALLNELRSVQFTLSNIDRFESFANIKVGANSYKVHEDLQNPKDAAITMDRLNATAKKLIDHLIRKYISNPNNLNLIKNQKRKIVSNGIKAMKRNFKTANMEENIPERSGGDTSYVIDKGQVFAMCLRDPKKNNEMEKNENDLTFVLIHELAHLFTSTYGHDILFWNNFNFLLQEAVSINLYEPVDYKKTGSPYCGIVVTYSPLFDKSLTSYYIQN